MLTLRIIPCLDVREGRVVKGVKFQGLRDAGSPVELAQRYAAQHADEIVMLDVSATIEGRKAKVETVGEIRRAINLPLTVGGGIRTIGDAAALLDVGADKVSVNTAAVLDPHLLAELASRYGRQCVVLAIDARRDEAADRWEVVIRSGRERTGIDALEFAARGTALGAGEILLTSWDRDGTRSGYDLDLLRAMRAAVEVPIIASGGASGPSDMVDAHHAGADAVLAASMFHDGDTTVRALKTELKMQNVEVRT